MKRISPSKINRMAIFTLAFAFKSFSSYAQQALEAIPVHAVENHVGLAVSNLDAQQKWYSLIFGMKEVQKLEIPEYHVRTVLLRSDNDLSIELIEVAGASRKHAYKDALDAASDLGFGHWAITVDRLEQVYRALLANGAVPVSPPSQAVQKGASFAYVKDPEGNLIELMQLPR